MGVLCPVRLCQGESGCSQVSRAVAVVAADVVGSVKYHKSATMGERMW